MKIVNGVEELEPRRRVVVLGTFDGVHLGHRRLIHEALERAQELACDHDRRHLRPDAGSRCCGPARCRGGSPASSAAPS